MSHVFPRVTRALPTAVSAEGAWITDADGRRYLDAAGGAIVVGVGHGDRSLIEAAQRQLARTQYVHGTMFTTESVEAYADALAPLLPLDAPRVYPVSGGSEAVETAIKMVRAYHLAVGQGGRSTVIARRSSYHGNTLGALDLSGKEPLRKPYTPWLGRFLHAPRAYEYRCENPSHPAGCGDWHAAELQRMIESYGPETVAAFVAEPVVGRHAGGGGAVRRLLAQGDRGLPSLRRPRDRRRGDDRVRAHRTVVRGRSLGRSPGHRHRRQGHDERLRPLRVRGLPRRDLRSRRAPGVRARVHVVAQRARGRGRPGDARAAPRRRPGRSRREAGRDPPRRARPRARRRPHRSARYAGSA